MSPQGILKRSTDSTTHNRPDTRSAPITLLAVFFVVLVCASLAFIDGWRSWAARKNQLAEAQIATANMARSIAQHADDTIKGADTSLLGLVERVQADGTGPAAVARLHKLMALRVAELPQLAGLFIYGENGEWIVHSQAATPANANNADRDYFIYHRTHASTLPFIGEPLRSRSSGQWILTLSRRINHADGSFAGVALATIGIDYFNTFYDSFNIGKAGAIVLGSDQGILLTRRPLLADSRGKSLLNTPLFRHTRQQAGGSYTIESAQDGVNRQNSFLHLSKYPLFVSAALSEEEILTDWRADTYLHSAGVGVLLLVLGSIGFYLVGQIRRRLEAEEEILKARDALQALNQTLERLSLQDSLTGLANRRHFDMALGEEFNRAMRNASALALVMIDVDNFKKYNDAYGHAAGDECLRQIGAVIKAGPYRAGDLTARYGGEEMCVLLPGTDVQGALVVADRIRAAIRSLGLPHSDNEAGVVTISAGVHAIVPLRGDNLPLELIESADKALYAAKHAGRDRVCSYADLPRQG
ncbi:sensor domain-containing diguanylate cyclase [Undibacterium sp. TJN25]|uniref:sensor domain-containing diguanylate cyclase n=1 Tax=Undibacterium sp. TJN25 TaxID=3413056 RepID=UPI003BF2EE47